MYRRNINDCVYFRHFLSQTYNQVVIYLIFWITQKNDLSLAIMMCVTQLIFNTIYRSQMREFIILNWNHLNYWTSDNHFSLSSLHFKEITQTIVYSNHFIRKEWKIPFGTVFFLKYTIISTISFTFYKSTNN
jgi:hypothetical protein